MFSSSRTLRDSHGQTNSEFGPRSPSGPRHLLSSSFRRRERRRILHNATAARAILSLLNPPVIQREEFLRRRHRMLLVPRVHAAAACGSHLPATPSISSLAPVVGAAFESCSAEPVSCLRGSDPAVDSGAGPALVRDRPVYPAPAFERCVARILLDHAFRRAARLTYASMSMKDFFQVLAHVRRRLPHIVEDSKAVAPKMLCDEVRSKFPYMLVHSLMQAILAILREVGADVRPFCSRELLSLVLRRHRHLLDGAAVPFSSHLRLVQKVLQRAIDVDRFVIVCDKTYPCTVVLARTAPND